MSDDYPYQGDVLGVVDRSTYKEVEPKIDTRAKVPTVKHAQKLAMERGDATTYFSTKEPRKQGTQRGKSPKGRRKRATKR